MDARVLVVTVSLQRIEYCALLATAVGEVGDGDAVIELQEHTVQGGSFQDPERAFAFPGIRRLQLAHNILERSPQSGPRDDGGPFFLSVAFVAGCRARGREGDVQREADASFLMTRDVWSVMP
ncbi:hypothetical protein [Streptomyces humidus]